MKLRPLVFLYLVVIGSPSAHARGEIPLTTLKTLSQRERAALAPALNASFHFRMDPGVDCTGTFISSSGHFVTALHCLAGCLAKNHALTKELAIDEPVNQILVKKGDEEILKDIFSYKLTVDEDKVDEGITCPGVIGEQKTSMQVVMTGGKGWLAPKETLASFAKNFPEEYKALLDEGYEHPADFAVVQALDIKNPSCLNLSQTGPRVNQQLHAVSYPCLSRDDLSTLGKTPLYTQGSRTPGFRNSEYFTQLGPAKIPFQPALIERKETFFSSLDIEKCGSGTAILDEQSNVVGIATRIYKLTDHYEHGSLESIDVAQIWRDLMEKKTGSDIKEITTCHDRIPATAAKSTIDELKTKVNAITKLGAKRTPLRPQRRRT